MTDRRSRRAVVTAAVGGLAALAGCSTEDRQTPRNPQTTRESETGGTPTDETPTEGTPADGTTTDETDTDTPEGDLDLREANVVAVEFEAGDGREYRFDVTLIHDDDGEDGYANWWQVETTGGEQLGRRELLHAHGTREFTRSETISVPEGVTRVVVRGHDQTHGYGGQAMVVDLETGETQVVQQGSERRGVN